MASNITRLVSAAGARGAISELVSPSATEWFMDRIEGHEGRSGLRVHESREFIYGVVRVPTCGEHLDRFDELQIVLAREGALILRDPGNSALAAWVAEVISRYPSDPAGATCALLSETIQRFHTCAELLDESAAQLEDSIARGEDESVNPHLRDLRKAVTALNRESIPLRECLRRIANDEVDIGVDGLFDQRFDDHVRDMHEELLVFQSSLDSLRDLIAGLRDFHQTQIARRQNDVMQRLTVVASILLVPTFIVGLYGQNFIDMPEVHWAFGYLWSWGLIALVTAAQLVYFRRKGFLGEPKRKEKPAVSHREEVVRAPALRPEQTPSLANR